MHTTKELARKAVAASLLIALGDYVLLKIGMPIGPFLFAFGLLGVCVLSLNLFTGKCGFWFSDKLRLHDLMKILGINLISGYLFGLCMHVMDTDVAAAAAAKIPAYTISFPRIIMFSQSLPVLGKWLCCYGCCGSVCFSYHLMVSERV